jgi:hypothetical protein
MNLESLYTSALGPVECSSSRRGQISVDIHQVESWLDPRQNMDVVVKKNPRPCRELNSDPLAHAQTFSDVQQQ